MNKVATYPNHCRRGFTLIEMSIVLVIIGLIIGGVLVGRNLILAAQLRSVIKQIESYETAVATFKLKYNGIPGDLPPAQQAAFGISPATPGGGSMGQGNGDEITQSDSVTPSSTTRIAGEKVIFWYHLSVTGLISDSLMNATTYARAGWCTHLTQQQIALYLPTITIRNTTFVHEYTGSSGKRYFQLSNITGTDANCNLSMPTTGGLTPLEAQSLDSKVDDGYPLSGAVQTQNTSTNHTTIDTPEQIAYGSNCSNLSLTQPVYYSTNQLTCNIRFQAP